jgi:hypothetical protein
MSAEYAVWFLNSASGMPVKAVTAFSDLTYTKVVNAVGAFTIRIPSSQLDLRLINEDTRIVIYRKPRGGVSQIDFVGYVEAISEERTGRVLNYAISGYDLNSALARRIVAYPAASAESSKTGEADDVMKAIVRENLGALATDTTRDLTAAGFTVQDDFTLGTSIEKGFSYRNVLLVLQELSAASHADESKPVYFGIVPLGVGWDQQFQTNIRQWGMDHRYLQPTSTGQFIFSVETGEIVDDVRLRDFRAESNFIYAGGQGLEAARDIATAYDAGSIGLSPFARREFFAEATNVPLGDASKLQAVALEKLVELAAIDSFAGNLTDVTKVYGKQFGFGDYVTASRANELFDCRIDLVQVTVAAGVESVQVSFKGTPSSSAFFTA